ncbi:MAG: hypothetical protein B7X00_02190, partial [Legionella sp. 21-45-4]
NLNQKEFWSPSKSNTSAGIQLYPDGYDNGGAYAPADAPKETFAKKTVVVPETYHMGTESKSPQSFKNRDVSWVNKQNPQGYTIELSSGEQASSVASVLQKAPKNERMAEVKTKQDGKDVYQGIYGTYSSMESAQHALDALPLDVKQNARIKTWNTIQSTVSEE